jgi:hypothetical protein
VAGAFARDPKTVRLCKLYRGTLGLGVSDSAGGVDAIGGLARRSQPGAETAFRDGYLRHDDLRKPLTSKLRARCLKCGLETAFASDEGWWPRTAPSKRPQRGCTWRPRRSATGADRGRAVGHPHPTRCPNRHSLGSVEVLVGYRTFADTCQLNTSLRHLHLIDPMTVVTLLHPGAMGAAVGRQAVRGGSTVRRVAANRTTYVRRQGIYAEQIEVLAFTMLLPSAGSEAATRPTATARLVRCGRGRARGQACPALG